MEKKRKKISIPDKLHYWLMVLPAVVLVFLFNTRTWPGILAAFQDFIPIKGWFGSKWIGMRNFKIFFMQPNCWQIIRNTLVLAVGKIVGVQLLAIIFALMINEVRNSRLKRFIQTFTYLPHFISWVIFATILRQILGTDGLLNQMLANFGMENYAFLGTPSIFQPLMIGTEMLKEFGWSAIIYLSALTGIDPGLYEAAEIDGAI